MTGITTTDDHVVPPGGSDPDERAAWIALASVATIGPATFGRLITAFGTAGGVFAAARTNRGRLRIRAVTGRPPVIATDPAAGPGRTIDAGDDAAKGIRDAADLIAAAADDVSAIVERVGVCGLTAVTLGEPGYPRRLLELADPPPVLFVRGQLSIVDADRAVAVVGTRSPTDAGRRIAARIARAIGEAGATVVSGLAVGIDGSAHAAAVASGAPTVAVLGSGHARLYPSAHARLADEIVAAGGAVVAELHPDRPSNRATFPRRNRLISGLSDATIVVEAPVRSGALITARWALEQGRDCYVVPGPIDRPEAAGCLAFLREHRGLAIPVATIPDLIADLGLAGDPAGRPRPVAALELGPIERQIATTLGRGATTIDDLATAIGEPVATILAGLTLLEVRGLVAGAYGRYRLAGQLLGTGG